MKHIDVKKRGNGTQSGSARFVKKTSTVMLIWLAAAPAVIGSAGCSAESGTAVTISRSKYRDVDHTAEALKAAIASHGLKCPAIRNLNKAMAKHGVHLDRQVRVVEFCRADYARAILEGNPEVCTLMPCTFGVYEGGDGTVYISSMNQYLMGRMFGKTVQTVMDRRVAPKQRMILNACSKETP